MGVGDGLNACEKMLHVEDQLCVSGTAWASAALWPRCRSPKDEKRTGEDGTAAGETSLTWTPAAG